MEIEYIKADGGPGNVRGFDDNKQLRVAAYCRVSTDEEDQIKSYNSMVRHYTELIQSTQGWTYVDVYADKAITGTKVDRREEFQRMINDCMDGKIDMIIAKSLPRFARNTLDTLKYVRLLKEHNVAVYFEVEKINTLKDGEFLMTILSSVAQQEVENTSANVKKGLKMKMRRGEMVGFNGCMGYDYICGEKVLVINEEQAEVVRYIFNRYIAGAGSTMIAKELNDQGVLTTKGNPWNCAGIIGIIKNEKYVGDLLLGKTFTVDPISKRRLDNLGEEDRYYVKDHHEPIIDRETFEKAQQIRARRANRGVPAKLGKREKYSRQYAFSSMIECGFCAYGVSRRSWHSNSEYKKVIWQCSSNTKWGKQSCPHSKGLPEEVIEKAFVESYRLLLSDNKGVLDEFLKRTTKTLAENNSLEEAKKVEVSIRNIKTKRAALLDRLLEGSVEEEAYKAKDSDLQMKLSNARARLRELQKDNVSKETLEKRIKEFKELLLKGQVLEEFDRGIFESIIDKVIMGGYDENGNPDPYKITFVYKTGFNHSLGNTKSVFGTPRRNARFFGKPDEVLYSNANDESKALCTSTEVDTCRDGNPSVPTHP